MSSNEELRDMADNQLQQKLEENREELFNLRFQIETRKIKNHQRIPQVKKDIARIMTALRERELMEQYAGVGADEIVAAAPAATASTGRRGLLGRLSRGRNK